MNAYQTADADQHWREDQLEMQHAVEDYHREVFDELPDRCDPRCAWKDPWGFCIHRDKWPDCRLGDHFVEEGLL